MNGEEMDVIREEMTCVVNSLSEALQSAEVKWKNATDFDVRGTTYISNYIVAKPVYLEENHQLFANSCLTANNLVATARQMKEASNDPHTTRAMKELMLVLDQLLTKEVNEYIRKTLSIETLSIDSFVDDMPELPAYIRKRYGDLYGDLLANITAKEFFTAIGTDIQDIFNRNTEEETDVGINSYIGKDIAIALVGLTAKELRLSNLQPEGDFGLVNAENYALVNEMIDDIFSEPNQPKNNYYLRTADNCLFELKHTNIGKLDNYIIRRMA